MKWPRKRAILSSEIDSLSLSVSYTRLAFHLIRIPGRSVDVTRGDVIGIREGEMSIRGWFSTWISFRVTSSTTHQKNSFVYLDAVFPFSTPELITNQQEPIIFISIFRGKDEGALLPRIRIGLGFVFNLLFLDVILLQWCITELISFKSKSPPSYWKWKLFNKCQNRILKERAFAISVLIENWRGKKQKGIM